MLNVAALILDINTLTGGPAVGEYVSLALATPDRVRGQGWVISHPDEHQVTSPPAVVDLRPTSEFESGTLYIVWWRGARGFTFAKTDASQRLSEIDLMPVPETNAPAGIKLTDIRDTPETYAGQAGRALVVLDDESGTGFQRVASHDDIEAAEAAADKAAEDVARLAGQLETLADLEKGDVSSLTAQVNQNDNAITDLQRVTAENTGEISSEASTRRDADTALGKRIDGVRAEFPEFIMQVAVTPTGVAQASDLTREFSLVLGERLDVPADTRFLAVFAQNRNRDVSDEVQVVAYDARLPPQSVSFAVKQPNIAAVGVRSQDTGLNMALSFLDAGRQVIGDKPFTVPFAIGIGAAFGAEGELRAAGDTLQRLTFHSETSLNAQLAVHAANDDAALLVATATFSGGVREYEAGQAYYVAPHHTTELTMVLLAEATDVPHLPPWANITPVPAGLPGFDLPDHLDFVFTDRIGAHTLTGASLALAGQTDGITLSPQTPAAGVTDRGALLFTLNEEVRTKITQNLRLRVVNRLEYTLTLTLAGEGDHIHRGIILVNDTAFRPIPVVLAPAADAGNAAGVTSIVLPADFMQYRNLRIDAWDVARQRIAESTLSTAVLSVQTAKRSIAVAQTGPQGQHSIVAEWTPNTRALAVSQGDRILYAALE